MLIERLYTPANDEVVYHYCSSETLKAILESGRIRFTDINMLNDAHETRWGYDVFEEAADRLLKRSGISEATPRIDLSFIDSMDKIISPIQLIAHPFVACFSAEHDSLEQWRAYGDDGRGYAIGFKVSALQNLPITLLKVEYQREKQVEEMIRAIVATYVHHRDDDPTTKQAEFQLDCSLIATFMIAFKNPVFEHENEIRCVHAVNVDMQGDRMRFVDRGGTERGTKDIPGETIGFQVRDNHFVPHLELPIDASVVAEIIWGPKNQSASGNMALFLGGLGISNVKFRRSNVPYR